MGTEFFERQAWIEACAFAPHTPSDILSRIIEKVRETTAQSEKAYVLVDIDSTLYEVAPRTAQILLEASRELDLELNVREKLAGVTSPGYSLEDTWRLLGWSLQDSELNRVREQLHAFWHARFFSNGYLDYDLPYVGMKQFAWELQEAGAEIVYLTGRDEPGMREGTLRCLKRDGFPIEGTQLRMKSSRQGDDVIHKVGVALSLAQTGTVVASLENEPRNFAALAQALPEAIHVFVDTVCSKTPAPAVQGGYRLHGFHS